jgi:opacity protein-like surface antigen
VQDSLKVSSGVALANVYIEPLPRGMFTPYIGAGIGFVYNQIERKYQDNETLLDTTSTPVATRLRSGTSTDHSYGLAAALMAGMTFSIDQRWALDIGYRALYMDGRNSSITTPSFVSVVTPTQHSTATLGEIWEHQVRVGLRWNIW